MEGSLSHPKMYFEKISYFTWPRRHLPRRGQCDKIYIVILFPFNVASLILDFFYFLLLKLSTPSQFLVEKSFFFFS